MKTYIVVFVLSIFGCQSQNKYLNRCKIDLDFITNKKVKNNFIITSCNSEIFFSGICTRVVIDLLEEEKDRVNKINRECWLKLLNNKKSDYAANLILYSMYEEDASLLSISNESDWRSILKNRDIEYWSRKLN